MLFRSAELKDLEQILRIIEQAKEYLRAHGVHQWQEGYPDRSAVEADIAAGIGYVLADGEKVAVYVALSREEEPYLHTLRNGSWLEEKFCVIWHRICAAPEYRGTGASDELLDHIERLCRKAGDTNIRVDTHRGNVPMHRLLGRHGYKSCGDLTLLSGEKDPARIAFQVLL